MNHHHQQQQWQETLLALIGDNFCDQNKVKQFNDNEDSDDHICDSISGTILMHRGKNEKISLWTKEYKNDTKTRLIGYVANL